MFLQVGYTNRVLWSLLESSNARRRACVLLVTEGEDRTWGREKRPREKRSWKTEGFTHRNWKKDTRIEIWFSRLIGVEEAISSAIANAVGEDRSWGYVHRKIGAIARSMLEQKAQGSGGFLLSEKRSVYRTMVHSVHRCKNSNKGGGGTQFLGRFAPIANQKSCRGIGPLLEMGKDRF
ncbi:hypothetical protein MRB53_028814 [Persea americana]|uniref:Uncharacterized protein n=1 Tax=Persea americana TaxID=3435 RepID=A0ACC2KGK5_PERAE|nr:hypothetical protein MRB53_028814 [Persea americana]